MTSPLKQSRAINSIPSQKQLNLDSIENPQKVRVLILTEQKIVFQDYYFFKKFTNVIKLDLSYNKISQFPQGFSFKSFSSLKILFLHYNKIEKLKNLEILAECKLLVYFTLFGNPLQQTLARHFCINIMPWLKLMDDKPVKEQQKYEGILNLTSNTLYNEKVGFPLVQMNCQADSLEFLGNVMLEIKKAKDLHFQYNPIIKIQRWWKKQLKKNSKKKSSTSKKLPLFKSKVLINSKFKQAEAQVQKPQLSLKDNKKIESLKQDQQKIELQQIEKQSDQVSAELKNIKILSLLKQFKEGMQSINLLLQSQESIYCEKQFCELNGYKYKQEVKVKGKNIHISRFPINSFHFSISKQSSKRFLSLIFYNNLNYLVELKKRKYLKTTQLKNIAFTFSLVELDMSLQQKKEVIKTQYIKRKLQNIFKPFPILFGYNIIRISSAIKIQKCWRGYKSRSSLNTFNIVRRQLAAKKIQKWIRCLKFKHRHKFLMNVYSFLKNNDNPCISMRIQNFYKLQNISQNLNSVSKYFSLPFQQCNFELSQQQQNKFSLDNFQNKVIKSAKTKEIIIKLNSPRQPFPQYFSKFCPRFELTQNIPKQLQQSVKKNKLIDLLIKGASITKSQIFIDEKIKEKQTWITFEYSSKQDANNRKLILCLFTYEFLTGRWIDFKSIHKNSLVQKKVQNINDNIKEYNFIKIVYSANKNDKLFEKIDIFTKQIRKNSQISWKPLRIRYFEGSIDHSSIFIIGMFKQKDFIGQKQFLKNDSPTNSPRRLVKQLTFSKQAKDRLDKSDDSQIKLTQKSSISRNVISFTNYQQKVQVLPLFPYRYHYNLQHQFASLQSSHNSIQFDWNENKLASSSVATIPVSENSKLSQKVISPSQTISLLEKKNLIQKINSSHKYKIELLSEIKRKQTDQIRQKHRYLQQEHERLIRDGSRSSFMENSGKVKMIKNRQKKQEKQEEKRKFETNFLTKGNLSIKKDLRQFQKNRSQSNQHFHLKSNIKVQNSRYAESCRPEQKTDLSRRKLDDLRTEVKEFSIQLSQQPHLMNLDNDSQILSLSLKSKQLAKNGSGSFRKHNLSSAASQKIGQLYRQKMQKLKSEQSDYLQLQASDIRNSDALDSSVDRGESKSQKKVLRKKKMVHSVFPQQFYPLRDNQQIGFHLPKIRHNRS